MKLRRQAPAKAFIVVATAALLGLLLQVVRAEPRIAAEPAVVTPDPSVNYQGFFAPGATPSPAYSARD